MIIVQLKGGLGNQLFQYAAARSLSEKRHSKVMLDLNMYNQKELKPHEFYALKNFKINAGIADDSDMDLFYSNSIFGKIRRRVMRLTKTGKIKQVYEKKWFVFDPQIFKYTGDMYLRGYWQSEKYFKDIEDIIRLELSLSASLTPKTLEVSKEIITKKNTVSLHIRRGDYAANMKTYNVLGLSSLEYYKKCISFLEDRLGNLNVYIFSDDPAWARENLLFDCPLYFIHHNDVKHAYEDIYLMSSCEHNIIANSSFSWWGAWLNKNKNKIVLAPQKWAVNVNRSHFDLIPKGWNLL
jgi:hypothetical protein